jgi:hypothetical protein
MFHFAVSAANQQQNHSPKLKLYGAHRDLQGGQLYDDKRAIL